MPTWVCPFCEAEMSVKPQLIGQVRPCPKCEQESTITDAAGPVATRLPPRASRPTESEQPATIQAAAVASLTGIENETLTSVVLAQGLLGLVAVGSGLCLLFALTSEAKGQLLTLGISGLISVVIAWPIYTIANETYRSRKLLQAILANQK